MTYPLENVVLIAKTELAWLLRMTYLTEAEIPAEFIDNVNQWWVLLSLIESTDIEDELGEQGYVEVPTWFAVQEEMPDT